MGLFRTEAEILTLLAPCNYFSYPSVLISVLRIAFFLEKHTNILLFHVVYIINWISSINFPISISCIWDFFYSLTQGFLIQGPRIEFIALWTYVGKKHIFIFTNWNVVIASSIKVCNKPQWHHQHLWDMLIATEDFFYNRTAAGIKILFIVITLMKFESS